MVYILLVLLIILLVMSYYFVGQDFFAPSTMMCIVFFFSTICAIYKQELWGFQLGALVVFFIISSLSITFLLNGMIHSKVKKIPVKLCKSNISPIPRWVSLVIIVILLFSCILIFRNVQRIGGSGSISQMMLKFRGLNAYSTNLEYQLPVIIKQIINLANALCYIYIFHLIYFWRNLKKSNILCSVIVILLCVLSSLMTGGRFSAMCVVVSGMVMFYLVGMRQKGRYKTFEIKVIIKMIVVTLVTLYFFYAIKELIGRNSEDGILDYITHYFGGSILGFDLYLKNPPQCSEIWGKETFYSVINGLRKLNLLDVPYYYIHHEFRTMNGVSIGNIYTALRDYHYDFGVVGMYLLHTFFSLVMSVWYEYLKKRGSSIQIIFFAITYHTLVFYVISNCFFSQILSFGFLIKGFEIIILYKCLIEKRIKVKIK